MQVVKAITIIETAKIYYLLSNDHKGTPIHIGSRLQLEFALQNIDSDMVIATTGKGNKCIVIMDYETHDLKAIADNGIKRLLNIKNGKLN